ncbi:MAG: haloacid dehalogenase type II [Geminicoccaceae bacterium]
MAEVRISPKYISFDCYGTLTRFGMSDLAAKLMSDQIGEDDMEAFLDDFEAYRGDEVIGPFKPYADVIADAFRRACVRWNVAYRRSDAEAIIDGVPTWGPHPDVPAGLQKAAEKYPLVILSNANDAQLKSNVEKLGAPFHAVYTGEQAKAYKPRFRPFEYMMEQLGCGPDDLLHVSSSLRYDLITCHDLRIKNKVYVNRGYEPSTPYYQYHEIPDISHLPDLLEL